MKRTHPKTKTPRNQPLKLVIPVVEAGVADDDPHRLANLFLDRRHRHRDGLTLHYWQGQFYQWDKSRGSYREVPQEDMHALVTAAIKAQFDLDFEMRRSEPRHGNAKEPEVRKVTKGVVTNVLQALKSLTLIHSHLNDPSWIEKNSDFEAQDISDFEAQDILAARNVLIHVRSAVDGKPLILPATPAFFSTFSLDYNFRADAPRPDAWLGFLEQLWSEDQASIDTLQKWMGYLLTADTRQQKIMMLIGPKRSGKGTIARVIRALIGPDNTAGLTLTSLVERFGSWSLIGKLVAIVADARLSGRSDQSAIVEKLLSISGEDAIQIDRKCLVPWTGKLPTRLMLISNELPKLTDTSGALVGRMIILRLTRSFYGEEDTGLTDKLLEELPGILLWAIEGWRRLRERGRFDQPESGSMLVEQMEELTSPVGDFVKDRCEIGPNHRVDKTELFGAWKSWCQENGRDHPGTLQDFGRQLSALGINLSTPQVRVAGGRVRLYGGLRLKGEVPA